MQKDPDPSAPLSFARRYAVISLIAVLVTVLVLSILYRQLSAQTIAESGERNNVTVATTVLSAILPELAEHLRHEGSGPEIANADSLPPALLNIVRASVRETPIERIKIFNKDGIVLYSSREHEIGTDDRANPRFQKSIHGEVRSSLVYRDAFTVFEPGTGDDNLIETYVPIRQRGNAQPVGVLELYTDVDPMVRAMTHNELLIFAGIALVMVILYSFLLYVVRRLEKIVAHQRQTIIERNQTLEVLSARMLATEETERSRVAWELHEEIAQTLSAAKIRIEALSNAAAQRQAPSETVRGDEVVTLVQQAIHDVRSLAMDLRPPGLDDYGLIATTRWLCREAEQLRGRAGVTPDIAVREEDIPEPLKSIIFRVVQQTLRHLVGMPGIRDIRVGLKKAEGLQLVIDFSAESEEADEGAGLSFVPGEQPITDLWERTVLSGGSFNAGHTDTGRVLYQATWTV